MTSLIQFRPSSKVSMSALKLFRYSTLNTHRSVNPDFLAERHLRYLNICLSHSTYMRTTLHPETKLCLNIASQKWCLFLFRGHEHKDKDQNYIQTWSVWLSMYKCLCVPLFLLVGLYDKDTCQFIMTCVCMWEVGFVCVCTTSFQ